MTAVSAEQEFRGGQFVGNASPLQYQDFRCKISCNEVGRRLLFRLGLKFVKLKANLVMKEI